MQQTGTSLLVLVVLVLRGCSATNFANAYLDSLLSSANDRTYVTNAEQQMEETVHGISATTEELNEKAQSIISIANIFNVKSIDDVPLDDKPNGIVDDLRKRESELCVNVACTENKYRPIDGICNNINHPLYGASKTAQARLVAPEWEKTTVIAFQLDNPEEEVAVDPYGVNPTEVPILFHLHGNAIFELILLNSEPTSETVECKEGAKCLVNGIIIDVEEGNEEQDCTEGVNMGFTGNGMFVKGTCEGSFLVNYLPYAARIVLDPNGKETKILTPSNGEATPQTSEGILFPDLDSDPQLFWIDNRGRSLKVGKGSECDERTILMETKVTDKILTDKHSVAIAVSTASQGNVEVIFPIHETIRMKTSQHDAFNRMEKNLDAAPWLYNQGTLRFGVNANLKASPVTVHLHDNEQNIHVSVVLGLKNRGSIEAFNVDSAGALTSISRADLKNVELGSDFELYDGSIKAFARGAKNKRGGSSFWITWLADRITVGTGNIIGQGIINDTLYLTLPNRLNVNRVTLESTNKAIWYFDIVRRNIPRSRSLTGRPLPTARDVSLGLHSKGGKDTIWSKSLTNAVFQFGQFLDHDVVLTPTLSHSDVQPCCENKILENNLNQFCYPIIITDKTDASGSQGQFSSSEYQCLPFIRSTAMINCDPTNRDLRNRNMINLITSYVDASQVYGPEESLARELRENRTGALLATEDGDELPTTTEEGEAPCMSPDPKTQPCRLSGDPRNNEQPLLNGIHTLWVREHNRIVRALIAEGYKDGTDEEKEILYQEARRIVIATTQVITYKEYLPSFMDREILDEYQVTSTCTYDADINPSLPNEFGIAYRFGHTWIPILLGKLLLADNFFSAAQSHSVLGSDGVLDSMHSTSCPATDIFLEDNVRENLFRVGTLATDLSALNVQRGRDHGVGTYCAVREYFNLTVPETFDDMVRQNIVTEEMANKLKKCFDCVCDMDLFSAVLAETPLSETKPGSSSSIGPLLNHILADFFQKVKCGDRFWYEFPGAGFSSDQLREINKASLSRLLCDNVDPKIQRIQPNAFVLANDNTNQEGDCSDIPSIDLTKFGPSSGKRGVDFEQMKELEDLLSILRELEKKP